MSDIDECCSVCFRRVGINTGDDGTPPVDLGRCAACLRKDDWHQFGLVERQPIQAEVGADHE